MERLTRRAREGFTLAELLIVVAIIAVLVAISIPIFSSQLEKSRENTDLANLRAARAAAVAGYLTADATDSNVLHALFDGTATGGKVTVYYNAAQGKLVSGKNNADAIGKGTAAKGGCESVAFGATDDYKYTQDTVAKGQIIQVEITTEGEVSIKFVDA